MSGLDVFGADLAWEIYKDKNLEKQKMEQDPHYKCKEQIAQYKEQMKENRTKISNLKDQIKGNEAHITKLQQLYEKLCNDVTEKQEQTHQDYADWVQVDTHYKQYIKQLHEFIEKLKQLNVTLRMNQKQMNTKNESTENDNETNEYQSLKIELNALQKQNESIKYALETVKQNSKEENDNIKQQLIETLKLLNDIQIENKSFEVNDTSNDNGLNVSFKPTYCGKYEGIAGLFDENNVLEENENEENEMNALREEIKTLKQQLVANNEVRKTEGMKALIAENKQLKQQLETNNNEINAFKSEINGLENEINVLKQQNDKYINSNRDDLEKPNTEIDSLKKQINDKNTKITELENELQQQKTENSVNENIIIEQNESMQTMKEEIEQFQVLDELQREHIDKYRQSTALQQNHAENAIKESADEILKLTKLINELQDELEIEKELNIESQNEITEQKEQVRLLKEELEQLHVLEEMQQEHINNFRESGVIEAVMSQQDVEKDISNLTETIDLLEEQLSNEINKNEQYKNEIINMKKRNDELRSEMQSVIESKLKSMERSCKALEQLRNVIRLLQQQNEHKQIRVEKIAWGVLGPLSYHILDVATMND